jgi:hypothetical protein
MTTKQKIAQAKRIIQANKEYEEAKQLLNVQYAERFEELPVSECGEVYAQDVLALNEWVESERKRIMHEWVDKVTHA